MEVTQFVLGIGNCVQWINAFVSMRARQGASSLSATAYRYAIARRPNRAAGLSLARYRSSAICRARQRRNRA